MTEVRKKITFSLSPDTIRALKAGAKVDGRNLSRYAEAIFIDFLKIKPKPVKKPVKPKSIPTPKNEDWDKMHDPVNFD